MTIELPMSGITVWWPGILLRGLGIGFLTGLFGVGGGFILTPALRILFGIPYPVAVGTSLLQIFVTGSLSAYKHWRFGHVDIKLGLLMASGALCGTAIGKRIMAWLECSAGTIMIHGTSYHLIDLVMNVLFLVLLTVVGITMLCEVSRKGNVERCDDVKTGLTCFLHNLRIPPVLPFQRSGIGDMSIWVPLIMGLFVGIMTGLLGVGGGFVMFPLLVYVIGVPTTMAVGTSAFQIVFASGYGSLIYYRAGRVELLLVALLVGGSFFGVQSGVAMARKLGGHALRKYFVLVIGAGILMIVYSLVRSVVFGQGG